MMDFATRYPEAIPLQRIDARTVAEALCQVFSRLGIPEEVLSDQGSNFLSSVMTAVFELLHIKHIKTSPYHPETDGMLERFHSTLKATLRKSCPEATEWDIWLPYVCFAYRDVPHAATGFSPFELMFGRHVRGPMSIIRSQWTGEKSAPQSIVSFVLRLQERLVQSAELAQMQESKAKAQSKTWYDKKARNRSFDVGAQVLALMPDDSDNLTAQWLGPYTVVEKVSPVSYRIETPERRKKTRQFHINMLREWKTPASILAVMCTDEPEEDKGELSLCTLDTDQQGEKVNQINPDLLPHQKQELNTLLEEMKEILDDKPGRTTITEHKIQTGDSPPIHQHPYRVPAAWQEEIRHEVQSMDVIEPSDSPWAFPIVVVRKKDGALRLCIDYRKLNAVTQDDVYQMPRAEELLERLGQASFITTLDLTKGYYQVPVSPEDRDKTAFTTPYGKYRFKTMPFGLKGAPTTFQRLMDRVLSGCH